VIAYDDDDDNNSTFVKCCCDFIMNFVCFSHGCAVNICNWHSYRSVMNEIQIRVEEQTGIVVDF
jgi:hypothetical protein